MDINISFSVNSTNSKHEKIVFIIIDIESVPIKTRYDFDPSHVQI